MLLTGGSCSALGEVGRNTSLPLEDKSEDNKIVSKLTLVEKLLEKVKSTKENGKVGFSDLFIKVLVTGGENRKTVFLFYWCAIWCLFSEFPNMNESTNLHSSALFYSILHYIQHYSKYKYIWTAIVGSREGSHVPWLLVCWRENIPTSTESHRGSTFLCWGKMPEVLKQALRLFYWNYFFKIFIEVINISICLFQKT